MTDVIDLPQDGFLPGFFASAVRRISDLASARRARQALGRLRNAWRSRDALRLAPPLPQKHPARVIGTSFVFDVA